jgi:hypothetical protein
MLRVFKDYLKIVIGLSFAIFHISELKAQKILENIVDLELSAGIQYLKIENDEFLPTGSLNLTLDNFYIGGGLSGTRDVKLDLGYHIINAYEFVLTPGYQRLDVLKDRTFANAVFLQSQFMISDNSFLKFRASYFYSHNANISYPLSGQIEYGYRFDMTGGNGMSRGSGGDTWSTWFSDAQ